MAADPRLTARMRLFCEALVKGGTKVSAAKAAGCKGASASCSVAAARWLKMPQVQKYLRALGRDGMEILAERTVAAEERAVTVAEDQPASRTRRKAMEVVDIIDGLSDEAGSDMGDFLTLDPVLEEVPGPDGKPLAGADGKPVMRQAVGQDGKPLFRPYIDIAKAFERGKTHLIKEVKIDDKGISLKLIDRQAAKVALARILGMLDPENTEKAKAALQVWAEALTNALRQPQVTPRDLYLAHMGRRPIDVQARVIGGGTGSTNGGNGSGNGH